MSNGTAGVAEHIGTILPIDITDTMQEAYLDYAMSVIVSRALPDVRDGLKPVHRRILYAMYHDLSLTHNKPHKKSARIVGEVLGKYHPHGDTAVYDAMVRMAQEFSLRYPLIDGQGNFGSIDGDNAAAMRYTEARLAEISDLMLTDLEKDTVDWHDNFDNSLREPDILPAALPNLLINGSSGIAVGMATNIPPHNLGEVVDALTFMIDNYNRLDEVTVEHLLQFIKGPDFPTGGILYRFREEKGSEDLDAVTQGYSVGKARLILQAKAHFEEMSRNRSRIVITELPYQTNKTALLERIASLVRDGKVEGITDLRDESDRTGMRIVIELTRNVDPKDILADLFKYTPLQQTFGMQMLALVDGQPRMLSLKRMLHLFIQHREVIIRRRSEYDLARARERAHILEGLLKALDILDEVIATIRRSQTVETARNNLVKNFKFTEIQAQAILDMQLRRLAALERKKLQDEYNDLLKRIAYLEDLLAHPEKILQVIKEDLLAIREKYADPRRTQIVDRTKGTLTSTDLLPEQEVWVSVSTAGDLSRANRGRLGKTAARQAAQGSQVALLAANTRDFLYLIARDGRTARVAIHEIPQDLTKHLSEFTDFGRRDDITAAVAFPRGNGSGASGYLFLVTEQGSVKRVAQADFLAAAAMNPQIMNVDEKDRLIAAFSTPGDGEVILVSNSGKSIRFAEEDVRSMGLAAGGVGGMKLKKNERIVYAGLVDPDGELLTATANGYGKRSGLSDYSVQGRNGGGIVTHKPSSRTGDVVTALVLTKADLESPDCQVALLSAKNKVTLLTLDEVPQMGRAVQGKQVMALGVGDSIARAHTLTDAPDATGSDDESGGPVRTADGRAAAASSNGGTPQGAKAAAATTVSARAAKKSQSTKTATAKSTATGNGNKRTKSAKPAAAAADTNAPPGTKASKPKATSRRSDRSKATKEPPQSSKTSARTGATSTPAKSTAAEPTTKKSTAKKSPAKKSPAKKSTAAKAATGQATPKPSPSSRRTAEKAASAPTATSKTRKRSSAKPATQTDSAATPKSAPAKSKAASKRATQPAASTDAPGKPKKKTAPAKAKSASTSSAKPAAKPKKSAASTPKSTPQSKTSSGSTKRASSAKADTGNTPKDSAKSTTKATGSKPPTSQGKSPKTTKRKSSKLDAVASVTKNQAAKKKNK
ncbi:MAG: DNA gyrase subunit A [Caldilineaceae bacterium]|nr:DNA gyrase subunit A [Caldilineaceae bacterium]